MSKLFLKMEINKVKQLVSNNLNFKFEIIVKYIGNVKLGVRVESTDFRYAIKIGHINGRVDMNI